MKHRLGALLGLLVLAGCQPAVNPTVVVGDCKAGCQPAVNPTVVVGGGCNVEKLGDTAVETRSKLVFVPARINGQIVKLMFDTGAEVTLLTPGAASRLHLDRDFEHNTQLWGVGGATAHFDARLDNFELAGLQLPLRSAVVADIAPALLQGGADEVLGTDVLRWFTVDLDAPGGKMTLYRPCRVTAPPWHEATIPLASVWVRRPGDESPRRLLLALDLDGVSGLAMLDTGTQISWVTTEFAARLGIDQKTLSADPAVAVAGTGANGATARVHRFHRVRFGAWVANDVLLPVLDLPQQPEPGQPAADLQFQGIVGQDVLSGRRLWFALAAEQVFISRSGSVTQP